jgi:hypothetical protein
MPAFRQMANGSFSVEVDGCYHCGPNHDSPKAFDYEVEVHYHGLQSLDARGFLMDNLAFRMYFEGLQKLTDSCELMAQKAAEFFWKQLNGRCKEIRVKVWGIKGQAMVEYILDCDPDDYAKEAA